MHAINGASGVAPYLPGLGFYSDLRPEYDTGDAYL